MAQQFKFKDLQRRRIAAGWTQAQVAEAVGVTANTVARWERGESRLTPPMARLLDMTLPTKAGRRNSRKGKP